MGTGPRFTVPAHGTARSPARRRLGAGSEPARPGSRLGTGSAHFPVARIPARCRLGSHTAGFLGAGPASGPAIRRGPDRTPAPGQRPGSVPSKARVDVRGLTCGRAGCRRLGRARFGLRRRSRRMTSGSGCLVRGQRRSIGFLITNYELRIRGKQRKIN